MGHPELAASPRWRRTGHPYFPVAAEVAGEWWVLRLNCFPDHPMWTLFVGGVRRFDIDDTPAGWGRPTEAAPPDYDVYDALAPVAGYVAYGSEVGQPCDNLFCCG
jgi:hypothetical protein